MDQRRKTVLVVSHDQAFIRRAVCDNRNKQLGKTLFFENSTQGCRLKQITKTSYVFISEEIKERIKNSTTYFQKMVNVRLYCDIHKDKFEKVVWGYTSAILHGYSSDRIKALLSETGTDEKSVLDTLKNEIGVDFDPVPGKAYNTGCASFTDYELLILAREDLDKDKQEGRSTPESIIQLKMLNDLVHMNDCALFCLNPYEYAVWPVMFSEIIEGYREKLNIR